MNAEIIAVGSSFLLGNELNSDIQYISKELTSLGTDVNFQSVIGENAQRCSQTFLLSLERSDLIILTCGTGTSSGISFVAKNAVVKTLGLELELNESVLQSIREYYQRTGKEISDNNLDLAMIPKDAKVFINEYGSFPGFAVEYKKKTILVLPSNSTELVPMFIKYIYPFLSSLSSKSIFTHTFCVFGLDEAQILERISDYALVVNPSVTVFSRDADVLVRLVATSTNSDDAKDLSQPIIVKIREALGEYIYGENTDNLQHVIVDRLRNYNMKIATAESCTGGLLSQLITQIPGSSDVFEFGVSAYANRIKEQILGVPAPMLEQYGAVSDIVAKAMAIGIQRKSGATLGISITGIAGPTGSTEEKDIGLVYVALADEDNVYVKELKLGEGNDRDHIRLVSALTALDLVRRYTDGDEKVIEKEAVKSPCSELAIYEGYIAKNELWYNRVSKYLFPWKGDNVREILRKIVFLTAVVVFVISSYFAVGYGFESLKNKQIIDKVIDVYTSSASSKYIEAMPDGYLPKFANLYQINKDIAGWLKIGDTSVNYPVVQTTNNDYYLKKDFNKKDNKHGIPFVDFRADLKNINKNLIVYGHNMRDGQMFGELTKYKKLDYFKKNAIVSFDTVYEESEWKVFSVFITNTLPQHGEIFSYQNYMDFENDTKFMSFVDELKKRSIIDSGIDILPTDTLLTLSTCTYEFTDARLVVVARKVRPDEDLSVDFLKNAKLNPTPLYPDYWYVLYPDQKRPAGSSSSASTSTSTSSKTSSSVSSSSGSSTSATASSSGSTGTTGSSEPPSSSASEPPSSSVSEPPSGSSSELPSSSASELPSSMASE